MFSRTFLFLKSEITMSNARKGWLLQVTWLSFREIFFRENIEMIQLSFERDDLAKRDAARLRPLRV